MSAAMHLRDVRNKAERKARAERREELARAKRATAASLAQLAAIQRPALGEMFWVRNTADWTAPMDWSGPDRLGQLPPSRGAR